MFGRGKWRAMWSRAVWQDAHGKYRTIQTARTSGTNDSATLLEGIFCVPHDVAIVNVAWAR